MMNAAVQLPTENLSIGHRQIRLGLSLIKSQKYQEVRIVILHFFYFHREHEISIGNNYYLYYMRNSLLNYFILKKAKAE